tara:strand:- start:866 stop:1333 length:468 start_codon:yes stop_codon:yes gene_type:complete
MKQDKNYYTEIINGQLYMECKVCGQLDKAGETTTALTCHDCVKESYDKEFPFEPTVGYKPTGKPRGWAFMKEYVDKDGNVYHKGKEQPKLKGTLKPTIIKPKPKKPKLSKAQKARIKSDALAEIHILKKKLKKAKYKKDIKKITAQIKKLQKIVK